MAPTPGLKKNRRNTNKLLLIFPILAFMVLCVAAYDIYKSDFSLPFAPANERYIELSKQRDILISEYNTDNEQINIAYIEINSASNEDAKNIILKDLINANLYTLSIINNILSLDAQMESLNLSNDVKAHIAELKAEDNSKLELHNNQDKIFKNQMILNDYTKYKKQTLECFNSIDFNQTDNNIIAANIDSCLAVYATQKNNLSNIKMEMSLSLDKSDLYLADFESYWDISRKLYKALANNDQQTAISYRQSLEAIRNKLDQESTESDKELKEKLESMKVTK